MYSEEEAHIDLTMDCDSEMSFVLKAYFYPYNDAQVTAASAAVDVTYSDGSTGENVSLLDFSNASKGSWMQNIMALYPTQVITDARVWSRCVEGVGAIVW